MNKIHFNYKKVIPDIALSIAMLLSIPLAYLFMKILFHLVIDDNIVSFFFVCFILIKIIYNIFTRIGINIYEKKFGVRR